MNARGGAAGVLSLEEAFSKHRRAFSEGAFPAVVMPDRKGEEKHFFHIISGKLLFYFR